MLPLVWRAEALADLETAADYISDHNPAAAMRLQQLFERAAETACTHPFLYRPGRVAGTREAVVTPNYIMVYRVYDDRVEITAALHTRQRYP